MGMGIHLRRRKEGTTTTTRASGHEHKHKLRMMGPPRNFFTKGDAYGVPRREREGGKRGRAMVTKEWQTSAFTGRRRGRERERKEREETGDMMPRGELQWEKLTDWSGQLTHPVSVSRKRRRYHCR